MRTVPDTIPRPSYADTGVVEHWDEPLVKSPEVIERMRHSGKIAAEVLRLAGEFLEPAEREERRTPTRCNYARPRWDTICN